jgi:hypothetical protein
MPGSRQSGLVPTLVLVPAVAGLYLVTGCGPASTSAAPGSPITTSDWSTRTTTQTTQPTTTSPTPSSTQQTVTSVPPTTEITADATEPDPDFAAVCADAVTELRVDDTECDDATDDYYGDDTRSSSACRPRPTTPTRSNGFRSCMKDTARQDDSTAPRGVRQFPVLSDLIRCPVREPWPGCLLKRPRAHRHWPRDAWLDWAEPTPVGGRNATRPTVPATPRGHTITHSAWSGDESC